MSLAGFLPLPGVWEQVETINPFQGYINDRIFTNGTHLTNISKTKLNVPKQIESLLQRDLRSKGS